MRILVTLTPFTAPIPDEYEVVVSPYDRFITDAEVTELIAHHQPNAIIAGIEPFTRNAFEASEQLQVISRVGVGMDSIDLNSADEYGITVLNTPDAPTDAVAEHAVGLIIAALHEFIRADEIVRSDEWSRPMGTMLTGKTVGIIGCGRIGSAVAELLAAFRCEMLGVDPAFLHHPRCRMVSIEEALEKSDIITLHVPLQPDTYHLIDEETIGRMKIGSLLVNTSRGPVVDEAALIGALETGLIAKAALDVYEQEPYSGRLRSMREQTILTPHIASNTVESRAAMESAAVENIVAFFGR